MKKCGEDDPPHPPPLFFGLVGVARLGLHSVRHCRTLVCMRFRTVQDMGLRRFIEDGEVHDLDLADDH